MRALGYRKAVKLLGKPQNCRICGDLFPEELKKPMTSNHKIPLQPTIHHITPRSHGGTDRAENLCWAHYKCNQLLGDRYEEI